MTQPLLTLEKHINMRPSLLIRHPLVSYFTLAYVIAWLLWLPLVLSKGGGIGLIPFTTDATVDGAITISLIILGAFGPAIAAVFMTAVTEGRTGVGLLFRRIARVRVGFQWYLVALFFPLLPTFFLLLLAVLLAPDQYAHVFSMQGGAALLGYVVAVLIGMVLGSPLGEEPGWRGFALSRLQQHMGPFKGSLLLGTLWGLWHAPLAFFTVWGKVYQLAGVVPSFLLFILTAICYAIVMTWMFNNTRGSIFLAIMFHSAIDSIGVIALILFPKSAGSVNASGLTLLGQLAIYAALWAVIAGIVLVVTKGRLSYQPCIEQEVYLHHVPPAELQSEQRDHSAS